MSDSQKKPTAEAPQQPAAVTPAQPKSTDEYGATDKPEPTRYGDWEIGGRCVDF